jgi:phosphate transport system ATP-binding protein
MTGASIAISKLSAWFDAQQVLRDIDIEIAANRVTAVIGPSGCGKSTFIRCINRLHERSIAARMSGRIALDGVDILGPDVDVLSVRRRVGMVFRVANPFPTMSIEANVLAGFALVGERLDRARARQITETALRKVGLWAELRERLDQRPSTLSTGQQQRLCLARALAVEPQVILLDEPCAELDPVATAKIEDLLHQLGEHTTIVIVTHNLQQAARVAERVAFFLDGELVEYADTDTMFTAPRDKRTEDYITGKFG